MGTLAKYRNARISAQKARLVADQIRGLNVEEAVTVLTFSRKKAARLIAMTLNSAISNARHNDRLEVDGLLVARIQVDEARVMKRIRPRARGRADRIIKRSCHILVELEAATG